MPTGNAAKRQWFFERSVAAYESFGGRTGYMACPICLEEFCRDDLDAGKLSLEDVPPKSVGGRPLCVTCRNCNSHGGRWADSALAEAAEMKRLNAASRGHGAYDGPVTVVSGGVSANAIFKVQDDQGTIEIDHGRNDPAKLKALQDHLQREADAGVHDVPFQISGSFRAGLHPMYLGTLRAAYLAAFATFGYRFVSGLELDIVRLQLRDPLTEHMPKSGVSLLSDRFLSEDSSAVLRVRTPVRGIGVYLTPATTSTKFGTVSIFPLPGEPEGFFGRLASQHVDLAGSRITNFSCVPVGWPLGPALFWDLPAKPDQIRK